MSVSQKKVLNHMKDSVLKLTSQKSLTPVFVKNSNRIIQRLSLLYNKVQLVCYEQSSKITELTKRNVYDVSVLRNLGLRVKVKRDLNQITPTWKHKDSLMSKCSISSQTQHVISSLESAENEETLLDRIEALISHISQYPEGRNSAIRAGAIEILLKVRNKTNSDSIQSSLREALALLGYSQPVANNGIRILSMDGGGIRGLLILEMLKKLEELTGRRVHELFDLICGVSTGAILAFIIGVHHKSMDDVAKGYKDISLEVFKQSALWGTGNLVWSQSYYDTALWEKKLREHLGSNTLISTSRDSRIPKLCAVSAVVNQSRLSAYVFRNYSLPWKVKSQYFGSCHHQIWEAARASAAAPTYFEDFKLGNFVHQDGGILVNNPTAVALHEAKLIWPNTPIQCIISFGTGRTAPMPTDISKNLMESTANTSWATKFYRILDSATDTEGVHIMLSDLLPDNVYYRFNPYLTEMISMVEINPQKLEQLQRDVVMYLRRNEDKFHEAAKVLTVKKSFKKKLKDYINSKKDLYGF